MIARVLLLTCLLAAAESRQPPGRLHQWLLGLRSIFEDCPERGTQRANWTGRQFLGALTECASGRALLAIDDILEEDVIPVIGGLDLVKLEELPMAENASDGSPARVYGRGRDIEVKNDGTWQEKLITRLARVLKTHAIKIDVERLGPTLPDVTTIERSVGKSSAGQVESRGRRRRRRQMQMVPMIMMGVLLMGTVLIPMGFQFLAVLGGKALLLAKMALMLTSIQGLKKVATSGVNYGLYHSPEPVWHERSTGPHDVPYSVQLSHQQVPPPPPPHHGYIEGFPPHFASRSAVQPT